MTIPHWLAVLACCALHSAIAPLRAEDDVSALRAAVAIERQREAAPPLPRSDFLVPPMIATIRLAPDGRHVAYLRGQGSDRCVWLLPTDAEATPRRLLASTVAENLAWSRDGRWLFLEDRHALVSLAIDGGAGVRMPLGGAEKRTTLRLDPSQPAAWLLREQVRTPMGVRWRVLRVDAQGRRTLLREDASEIIDALTSGDGRLAWLQRFEHDQLVIHRVDADGSEHDALHCVRLERCGLLATQPDGGLLLRGDVGGNFVRVLERDAHGSLRTLHEDPRREADLDDVALDPASQRPLVAHYRSTLAATYGIGAAQAVVAAILAHFPGRSVHIAVGSGERAWWLLSERDSTLQGERYHLFDPRTGAVRAILQEETSRPLPEAALARKIAFTYPASDGMRLHGFLLLPPGADPAHVALVAQPHGGPFNLARPGYDSVAQFLANRGYAVFQPNFRGSTGHGRDYLFAARGDFGNGRVQQDIVDGVRWLLAHGIGDAQRVGIAGHSFGGYSALQGVTFAPELFKVAVAGAPPVDFGWVMRWNLRDGELGAASGVPLETTLRLNDLDVGNAAVLARLHEQSPLANAGRLQRPVLLIAGGEDERVPVRSVVQYAAQLRAAGRDVSLYVEPEGGHSPTDPLPRETYLYLMETMLHRHLGGAAPAPPRRELRELLRRDVRVQGDGLRGEEGKALF